MNKNSPVSVNFITCSTLCILFPSSFFIRPGLPACTSRQLSTPFCNFLSSPNPFLLLNIELRPVTTMRSSPSSSEGVKPSPSDDTLHAKTLHTTYQYQDETDVENDSRLNEVIRPRSMELIRTVSRIDPTINPFLSSHPSLDPNCREQFNARKWAKALLQHSAHNPEEYPRLEAGVAWRNLSVHGFGTDTDYQKDVLNVLYQAPLMAKQFLSNRRQKIDILREFDGLVRSGEMLLVLGRPGSGVTTLLKTIAGETEGLHLDKHSHFSYQGQ